MRHLVSFCAILLLARNPSRSPCKQPIRFYVTVSLQNCRQKSSGSMENDETYVPFTRSKYRLPNEKHTTRADYAQVFEETPLYSLTRMFVMQALYVQLLACGF